VFTDVAGLAMATADPEKNNREYVTDKECPIIWYMMDTDICRQGQVILDAIDEIQKTMGGRKIRMIWQPMMGKTSVETFYKRDILEIADTMLKIREKEKRDDINISTGLATSWYPSGRSNHMKALCIARLNLAVELLSYYWLRVRCIDLSKITMVPRKSKSGVQEELNEDETINIRGYEDEKFCPRNYRDLSRYPMEIAFYPARRAREILRKVFQVYGIEPDWEKARNARDTNWRIEIPAVYTGGRFQELPAPREGERTHLDVSARVTARVRYEKNRNYEDLLPSLQLMEYPWEMLNTQSLDETLPLVTDIQTFNVSGHNQILDEKIPRSQITYRIERRLDREGESESSESTKKSSALERLGPKVKTLDAAPAPETETLDAAPAPRNPNKSTQDEYDSWGEVIEVDEANQSLELVLEDPCPVEPLVVQERSPRRPKTRVPETRTRAEGRGAESEPRSESESRKRTAKQVEPEPSKRVRDDNSQSAKSVSQYESSDARDDSSDESSFSSSSDEEERKERRVRATLDFLDRYDEKEMLRRMKRQKLKKQWEKARKLRQDAKKAPKK
jgi:hypothetical protein